MKRTFVITLIAATLLLSGCIVPARGVIVASPAVAVVHTHGPGCGHFWGYHESYPVYFEGGRYSYWDGSTWIVLGGPPVVRYYRPHYHHRTYAAPRYTPAPRYYYRSAPQGHGATRARPH